MPVSGAPRRFGARPDRKKPGLRGSKPGKSAGHRLDTDEGQRGAAAWQKLRTGAGSGSRGPAASRARLRGGDAQAGTAAAAGLMSHRSVSAGRRGVDATGVVGWRVVMGCIFAVTGKTVRWRTGGKSRQTSRRIFRSISVAR